jgi:hypothetical protein
MRVGQVAPDARRWSERLKVVWEGVSGGMERVWIGGVGVEAFICLDARAACDTPRRPYPRGADTRPRCESAPIGAVLLNVCLLQHLEVGIKIKFLRVLAF